MNDRKILCDLCATDEATIGLDCSTPLCTVCAESIQRLMRITDWSKNRAVDKARNAEQAKVLVAAANGRKG